MQPANLLPKHDSGNNRGPRAAEPATERDRVDDVHVGGSRESALVMAAQDVERNARYQVHLGVETDVAGFVLALALVRDAAIERILGFLGARCPVYRDVQLQVHGQGQPDDVEARADVGRRARRADYEGLHPFVAAERTCPLVERPNT